MKARLNAVGTVLICVILLVACGSHATVGPTASVTRTGANVAVGSVPEGDWTEFDYDARRSGVGPPSTGITAGNLNQLRRRLVLLDGTVDSAPIELQAIRVRGRSRDVVVVTTTYGRTIALDARSGAKLWEYVPPDIGAYERTAQITTTTPIADPDRRHVYVATPDGRIRKLVLATGRELRSAHWPAGVTFDATREKLASALNISGHDVIAVTGGYYGDPPPYQGHVALINRSTGRVTHVWNSLCSNRHHLIDPPSSCPASDAAIWARAGAVVEPGSHRILIATGNAPFDGVRHWGDSVLELAPNAGRLLHNWTPADQARLNSSDGDVGSTAPALLPEVHGVRLAVQGGKDGQLRLLRLDRLNGTAGKAGRRLGGELQSLPSPGSGEVLTAPVVWAPSGLTYVFVANDAGTAAYVLGSNDRLRVAWENSTPGTSPIVAGGLLYVYDQTDGRLAIRRPTSGQMLISLPAGAGHWNSPIVIGGRIILPEGNANAHSTAGRLDIYHLPGR